MLAIVLLISLKQVPITYFVVMNTFLPKDMVVLMTARSSRIENQDVIDAAIVGMLADPKEASRFLSCHLIKL